MSDCAEGPANPHSAITGMPARKIAPLGGEPVDRHAGRAEGEARAERAPLADPLHHGPDEPALHDHRAHAHGGEHEPDRHLPPAVPVAHVEDGHGGEHHVRELHQEEHGRDAVELAVRAQELQRAHGIRAPPRERRPLLPRQRLGQHEVAVGRVREREDARHPERQPRIDAPEDPAQRRPQREAQAETRAHHAEGGRALLRHGHVGDIGESRREVGRRDARDHPAHEEPREVRRQGHQEIVESQPEAGDEDHRPAPEAVRQGPQDGHGQELHQGPGGAENPVDLGRRGRVAPLERFN